jgi:gamma-glutamyl-gamma-aminobutyrate hydrolase PuuD
MIVGISMRTAATPYGEIQDALARSWIILLERFGVVPLLIPNALVNPGNYARHLGIEKLLLTGGDNFGPVAAEGATAPSARDMTETALIDWAIQEKKAILGVCRGLQILNIHFGGGLTRNLEAAVPAERHRACEHEVRFKDGTTTIVNSYHDQGVLASQLAPECSAVAITGGGVVEALSHRSFNIAAVQWHPERSSALSAFDRDVIARWLR